MEFLRFFEDDSRITAYFTTRNGGVSTGEYASLNLAEYTLDSKENTQKNQALVKEYFGINNAPRVSLNQVHGNEVAVINAIPENCAEYNAGDKDGVITNIKNVLLTTGYADCVPVYLYDPINMAVGLAHCGWKGTMLKCAITTLEAMCENYGTQPKDVRAAIGAAISFCCFETGVDVYEKFLEQGYDMKPYSKACAKGKYLIDLKGINKNLLLNAGVQHIEMSEDCTACSIDKYFSYRKENGKTGRMNSGIIINN